MAGTRSLRSGPQLGVFRYDWGNRQRCVCVMRLSASDITVIRALVEERFGPSSGIWLFGSRLDDAARGGDIDLYVEPEYVRDENLFLARQAIKRDLERRLGQPVDLVINVGNTTAFMRQAREEGCRL
jgi:predicted nucleotidyltransferase